MDAFTSKVQKIILIIPKSETSNLFGHTFSKLCLNYVTLISQKWPHGLSLNVKKYFLYVGPKFLLQFT